MQQQQQQQQKKQGLHATPLQHSTALLKRKIIGHLPVEDLQTLLLDHTVNRCPNHQSPISEKTTHRTCR